ncbi:MAG: molybdate ABC transporter permease subunit [Symploca sp. SIO2E9]|nr:molybdate ABC transporter permease subunit [Symploca sp. SIO2E9]
MAFELEPLWISLKTVLSATLIASCLGIVVARKMASYQGKAKGLIDGLLTLPLVLPPTVVGFFLLLVFGKNSWIGKLLSLVEINVIFSWTATVIAATVVAFPLMYKTALGAFKQIDQNLLYAARTLGASEGTVFWRVTLPLAWQGVLAGTILAFARALGEFGATLMIAGNIPGKTQTIPLAIFFAAEGGKMEQALIWVLVIVGISLAVVVTLNYLSEERLEVRDKRWKKFNFKWGSKLIFKLTAILREELPSVLEKKQHIRPSPSLEMDILKKNHGFTLEVDFKADKNPLGLLGSSGSGKSMTLRCLAGLETPTAGRIVLNGRVLFDSKKGINLPSCQRRIGFLFQNYALFPHMSVAENIAFGLHYGRYAGLPLSKVERRRRVADKIALVQLQGLENRYPHQLSGGQQQRVALARALAIEPEALLLDEPFSALDTYLRSWIEKQLIDTLSTYPGITLFVTHNLEEAYRVCKNLLVLSAGRVIAFGPKADIFERSARLSVAQLTQCKNFSRAQAISPTQIEASDWGCTLRIIEPIPSQFTYVGIRAHHIVFTDNSQQENSFPAWLVQTSETPHRMTLYLKLNSPPTHANDYHLQAEVYKEKWALIKEHSFQWYVYLDPLRLLLMSL